MFSDALVTPSSTVCAVAGSPPSARIRLFVSSNSKRSISSDGSSSVSPALSTVTLRSIWRTMISTCLSLIVTPWDRYTFWTSATRKRWTVSTPLIWRRSFGFSEPSVSASPAEHDVPVGHAQARRVRHRVLADVDLLGVEGQGAALLRDTAGGRRLDLDQLLALAERGPAAGPRSPRRRWRPGSRAAA